MAATSIFIFILNRQHEIIHGDIARKRELSERPQRQCHAIDEREPVDSPPRDRSTVKAEAHPRQRMLSFVGERI